MERDKSKKIILLIYVIILILSVILISLNLDTISVIHYKKGMLQIISYETYSSLEISLLYILIILSIITIFLIWTKKLDKYSSQIISLTPVIALIIILLFLFNPHSTILFPLGSPPTLLDNLNIGGYFSIGLYGIFIIVTVIYIYLEGRLSKYAIYIAIIIGALLLSDFIHESGHAIFTLISGGEVTEFYPFPVLLGGEFAAGYVGFRNVPSNLIPLVLLGGEICQWITIVIIGLILLRFKLNRYFKIFLLVVLLIAWLDFPLYVINNSLGIPHWFLIGGIQGDILMFIDLTGFPLFLMIIFACVQLFIGIIAIIFRKKLFSKRFLKEDLG